ncbi:hypothetical protein AsAng_0022320 [Aureispira anguillae]|uniref:Uncharacterized protein n=1 Tax=Aureispira anguillae TaxID=2864201 RepID=A0A915YEA7_9BACT|nr:hypothetical protein AsAng_0022320 [Aureispira anguillae]
MRVGEKQNKGRSLILQNSQIYDSFPDELDEYIRSCYLDDKNIYI